MEPQTFDFKRDVVDQSFVKPVLIDFWADWCGPCKVLGPILEGLEADDQGKWKLVKIDTEEFQEIAAYFKIQSIPNCKLVFEGKIIDEFSGAQSKSTIRKWLDTHLSKLIVEEADAAPDDFNELLEDQRDIPDRDFLKRLYLFVDAHPGHQKAILALVKHEVFFNPDQAIERIQQVTEDKEIQELHADLNVIKTFVEADWKAGHPIAQKLYLARNYLFETKIQDAIEEIISSIHQDVLFGDGIARKMGIALFHILGTQHPITKENRKLFDMAIW
ncbi:MAG: tetratricopeptide repeat protein [Saprospiraceae bacterium]|nr:tetratricopeptide repeat protein [Saprospiraceae bacterium]